MALTVLIAKDNRVTANFALVQPSLQADLPKVLEAIAKVIGGPVPKLEDLPEMKENMARPGNQPGSANEQLRPFLRPIIQKDASPDQVATAIKQLEKFIAENEEARRELKRSPKRLSTMVN